MSDRLNYFGYSEGTKQSWHIVKRDQKSLQSHLKIGLKWGVLIASLYTKVIWNVVFSSVDLWLGRQWPLGRARLRRRRARSCCCCCCCFAAAVEKLLLLPPPSRLCPVYYFQTIQNHKLPNKYQAVKMIQNTILTWKFKFLKPLCWLLLKGK